VISNGAEDTLIVVGCRLWCEGNDDSRLRFGVHRAFDFGEREQILVIGEKLECGWEVTVVNDIEQSVCVAS